VRGKKGREEKEDENRAERSSPRIESGTACYELYIFEVMECRTGETDYTRKEKRETRKAQKSRCSSKKRYCRHLNKSFGMKVVNRQNVVRGDDLKVGHTE